MPHPVSPKLIIEGARFTLKTALARTLCAHAALQGSRPGHEPILVSAESCCLEALPWGRGLINFAPAEETAALHAFSAWVELVEQLADRVWVFDRFHIAAQAYQQRQGRAPDFRELERRLHAVNARVILCTRTAESFAAVRAAHLQLTGGDAALFDDVPALLAKQAELRALAAASALDVLDVDVSGGGVEIVLPRVLEWIGAEQTAPANRE